MDRVIEFIPGRIDFISTDDDLDDTGDNIFFSVDDEDIFKYRPINFDFGPPTLSVIYHFVQLIREHLDCYQSKITLCSYANPKSITHNVFLMTSYRVVELKMEPEEAYEPFKPIEKSILSYVDATPENDPNDYKLPILSCLKGLSKAIKKGWFNVDRFDPDSYNFFSRQINGGFNWIIPGKLLGFPSPLDLEEATIKRPAASQYAEMFKQMNVKRVVRLCEVYYDKEEFLKRGIILNDKPFEDGSNPTISLVNDIVHVMNNKGTVAVHCRAGLGRTYVFF